MDMKRTVFFFYPFSCRHAGTCPAHVGRVPAPGARQLSVGQAIRLIEKARGYDLSNAGKGYLPQFSLSGKATYQSDITRLPVEIPNLDIKTASKDQYQVMLESAADPLGWWGYTFQKTIDACRLGSGTGKTACRHVCLD